MSDYELKPFSNKACSKCGAVGETKRTYYSSPYPTELVQVNGQIVNVSSYSEFLFCECEVCGYQWLSKTYDAD